MKVTRSWLSEFIDLSDVTNDELYAIFNAIGLEVENIQTIEIPPKSNYRKNYVSCLKTSRMRTSLMSVK